MALKTKGCRFPQSRRGTCRAYPGRVKYTTKKGRHCCKKKPVRKRVVRKSSKKRKPRKRKARCARPSPCNKYKGRFTKFKTKAGLSCCRKARKKKVYDQRIYKGAQGGKFQYINGKKRYLPKGSISSYDAISAAASMQDPEPTAAGVVVDVIPDFASFLQVHH